VSIGSTAVAESWILAGDAEDQGVAEVHGARHGDRHRAARLHSAGGCVHGQGLAAHPGRGQPLAAVDCARAIAVGEVRWMLPRGGLVRGVIQPQPGVDTPVDHHRDEHQQHDQETGPPA